MIYLADFLVYLEVLHGVLLGQISNPNILKYFFVTSHFITQLSPNWLSHRQMTADSASVET